MRTTRLRRPLLAVLLGATLALPPALPAGDVGPLTIRSADAACRKATVGGRTKCLGRGQFCAPRNQSDYRRAGFVCRSDGKGRNRLY